MQLGRVIGTVVPCVRYEGLAGVPFLFVQPLDRIGTRQGEPLVAADATKMAGPGELILYEGGREAAMIRGLCRSITPSSASSIGWTGRGG